MTARSPQVESSYKWTLGWIVEASITALSTPTNIADVTPKPSSRPSDDKNALDASLEAFGPAGKFAMPTRPFVPMYKSDGYGTLAKDGTAP
jgi:hypothetical protein